MCYQNMRVSYWQCFSGYILYCAKKLYYEPQLPLL